MRTLLSWLGFKILYVCDWGTYSHRYNGADRMGCRPIHEHMSVAPPWARLEIHRKKRHLVSKGHR